MVNLDNATPRGPEIEKTRDVKMIVFKKKVKTFHRNEEQEFASVMFNCWERKKKPTKPQRNISMKFQNIGDKEKTLKTSRENEVTYERWGIRLAAASPQQCWRQLSNAFQIRRENGNKDVFTQDSKISLMHLLKQGRGPRKRTGNKARQILKKLEMGQVTCPD